MEKADSSTQRTDSVLAAPGLRWSAEGGWTGVSERLAAEAPLAVEIAYARQGVRVRRMLAITMRTPGADEDLALGFLFGEGLIGGFDEVAGGGPLSENARGEKIATWCVEVKRAPREDLERVSRGLITSSACGLCGRPTMEGLPLRRIEESAERLRLSGETIARLPELLRRRQNTFEATGGCHGAALCDEKGGLLLVREDVGRHNAVDKLVGAALKAGIPTEGRFLVLSGRASFELVQKAAAAGIAAVVAVGAPSSLAVTLAHEAGIVLIGFARGDRFTVYTHAERLAEESALHPR